MMISIKNKIILNLAMIFSLLFCYSKQITNHFTQLFGDNYDTIIETSILQHWYNVVFCHEKWNLAQYFYPYQKTLGYNDGYFLFGMIYAPIFAILKDPFLANEITGIFLHVIGFYSFYILSKYTFKFSYSSSIFGSFIFVISNNIFMQAAHHMQILVIYFLPTLCIILNKIKLYISQNNNMKFLLYCLYFSLLYAACLLTGFYISWFFTFFIVIFLVVFVIISYKSDNFQYIKDYFSKNIKKIIFFIFTNIIFLLPFLSVYLEKATETGMHHWSDSHYFSPHIYDIFNIGSFNIYPIFLHYCLDIFHNCMNNKNHISNMNYVYSEFSSGFPPITLLISFLGIINKIRLLENKEKIFYQSFFVANIIVFILPLRLGIISPWHLVYSIVPGAKGLRVVVRFFLFETFPICIGLACFYDMLEKTKKQYFFLFLSFLIIIEQVNYSPVYNLSRNSSLNIQKSIPKKPETCKVFFVIDKPFDEKITSSDISKNTYDLYHANVFAMFYSELHNTPTIAGFSTFNPPDWNFASPYQDAVPLKPIIERALQYAHKHQITDSSLCYIDLRVNKWIKLKE